MRSSRTAPGSVRLRQRAIGSTGLWAATKALMAVPWVTTATASRLAHASALAIAPSNRRRTIDADSLPRTMTSGSPKKPAIRASSTSGALKPRPERSFSCSPSRGLQSLQRNDRRIYGHRRPCGGLQRLGLQAGEEAPHPAGPAEGGHPLASPAPLLRKHPAMGDHLGHNLWRSMLDQNEFAHRIRGPSQGQAGRQLATSV